MAMVNITTHDTVDYTKTVHYANDIIYGQHNKTRKRRAK